MKQGGRWGSAAKQSPHRPDSARAHGLRARLVVLPLYSRPHRPGRRFPMNPSSWLRRLFARTPCTTRQATRRFQPCVEGLEDRTVPAVDIITVGTGPPPGSAPPGVVITGPDGSVLTGPGALPPGTVASTYPPIPVNQPPTVQVPGAQTAYEDVSTAIPGGITLGSATTGAQAGKLSGITVGDPDGGSLNVTLAVSHGTLTLPTTTGLTVTGNGTAKVTLSGSIGDLNRALTSLVYLGSLNYSGPDTLSITASDGSLSKDASVAITVKSASQQASDLKTQVNALSTAGGLNAGQANALTVSLNLKGTAGDIDKVQSFLAKVQEFVSTGVLTQHQANTLLGPGNTLLQSVTQR